MANVTLTGTVTRSVEDARNANIKETYIHSYTPQGGETVTKEATRYWTVWFADRINLKEGVTITVTGEYATVSGEPKADGKVWPTHKINAATIVNDQTPIQLTKATDLLTQLNDVPF